MLQQYKIQNTYYGYDDQTKELVAFPDEPTLRKYFPQGIDPKAKPLPLSEKDGLVVAANQNPGKAIDVNTLKEAANQPKTIEPFDPNKYGISPEIWNSLSNADKAFVESTTSLLQGQFDAGQSNVSINQDLLNKALISAQNDPNIISRYGDAAKIASNDLSFNLGQISANYATEQTQQQMEMAKAKKDLAETEAAAGRAYSGFRGQAENLLGAGQANIIQSTKSQLQQQLQLMGRGYEQQYGSTALKGLSSPISAGGQTYQPIGDITGTIPGQKQSEIEARQLDIYNREKL